jgi:hypothetical protein
MSIMELKCHTVVEHATLCSIIVAGDYLRCRERVVSVVAYNLL